VKSDNDVHAGLSRRRATFHTSILDLIRVTRDAGLKPRTLGTGAPA